ncbi:MAG: hypothetical protein IJR45_05335, partial [Firmicutes bacterium]|nr:hypothetical protein [Bacillota bacterium]
MKKDIFKTMIKAVFTIMAVICMATSVQASAAGDAIYKAIKNGDKSVDVSSFHMKPKQAMDEYFNVVSANPDLFYVDYHVDCKFDTQSGECKELICGYNTSDIKGARTKFDTAVNTAIASAKGLAAKYDQAKAVHDYMIENFDFSADGITAY